MGDHDVGNAGETGRVGAEHVVAGAAVLLGRGDAGVVDVGHDVGQLGFSGGEVPAGAAGVLLHLEGGGRHTAGVGGLTGAEEDAGLLEGLDGLRGGGHVGALGDHAAAAPQQGVRGVAVELVLGGAGQGDVTGDVPHGAAGHEAGAGAALDVVGIG